MDNELQEAAQHLYESTKAVSDGLTELPKHEPINVPTAESHPDITFTPAVVVVPE